MYEWLRLGKHCPISEKIRDGILRVSKSKLQKLGDQAEVDDWFKYLRDTDIAAKLKLYAQTCKHSLGKFLGLILESRIQFIL